MRPKYNVDMTRERQAARSMVHGGRRLRVCMGAQVMRMVSGLLNRLPTMESESFRGELLKEFSDAAMVNVLSLMTKGVDACNNLVERSHAAYDTSFKG